MKRPPDIAGGEMLYLRRIDGIDPLAVGEHIGAGAQHVVRAYEDADEPGVPHVIKYPRARTLRDIFSLVVSPSITPSPDQMERDVELCSRYLAPFTVAPEVHTDAARQQYALVQDRLRIDDLLPSDIADDPELRRELLAIIEANRELLSNERLWFDFMGWSTRKVLRGEAYLDNVSKRESEDGPRLAIFDCTLFAAPGLSLRGIHAWFLQQVQRLNLRRYGLEM